MIEKEGNNKYSVKLYEYYNTKEEFIIVMELCEGTLLDIIINRENPFNFQEIKHILKQLNHSFEILTKNKVIHRALNIDNILIKYEDITNYIVKLKITDDYIIVLIFFTFISSKKNKEKLINEENYDEYSIKEDNKNFISPEILKKEKFIEKSDLWSLRVIIYVLAFNNYPYEGEKDDVILDEIKKMKLNKTLNNDLNDLIERLLIEDPMKRISWNDYFNHSFLK